MFNDHPSTMTADARLDQVAALLAAAFLRWKCSSSCHIVGRVSPREGSDHA